MQGVYSMRRKSKTQMLVKHNFLKAAEKELTVPANCTDLYIKDNMAEDGASIRSHTGSFTKSLPVMFAEELSAPTVITKAKPEKNNKRTVKSVLLQL